MNALGPIVYIAGPYSGGDTAMNVHDAIHAANTLADAGFAPFLPHLTHFWHLVTPRPYAFWLALDNRFLPCCDVILRLPGVSPGADKEVTLAVSLDIPVYTEIDQLIKDRQPPTK
jgi:Domain of unknown function (DUF4406)